MIEATDIVQYIVVADERHETCISMEPSCSGT